jgi:hypothetical protein
VRRRQQQQRLFLHTHNIAQGKGRGEGWDAWWRFGIPQLRILPLLLEQKKGNSMAEKIVAADAAVQIIADGMTIATDGFVGIGFAEEIAVALEKANTKIEKFKALPSVFPPRCSSLTHCPLACRFVPSSSSLAAVLGDWPPTGSHTCLRGGPR